MTKYFDLFPQILYTIDGVSSQRIRDFTRRVSTTTYAENNSLIYSKYSIEDGETPEIVANKFYGSCDLYWIILITNQIVDPRFDWCLSEKDLISMSEEKYSSIYGIHHYENKDGYITDNTSGTYSVNNIDYEISVNEKKRNINILLPSLVNNFVNEFTTQVNS